MKTLIKFTKWWNETLISGESELCAATSLKFSVDMARTVAKYFHRESGDPIRMSSLGKPIVHLAYSLVKPKPETFTPADMWVLSMGDYAEALIKELMHLNNFEFTHDQYEVELGKLHGHIDGVVDGETVFDIKAMSTTYWKSFTAKPDNVRGYLTQLSLYQYALQLPKAAFLCLNKVTGQLKVVKLPTAVMQAHVREAHTKLQTLKHIQNESDLIALVKPEPPRKLKNDKLVVPESMEHSPYKAEVYGGDYYADVDYFNSKWLDKT
jgi:hypothetical protein